MAPRVSVIVPTRNRRVALGRALASVEAQSYRDFEVVVADDASTDGTAAWLVERFPAIRVAALDKARGAAAARNSALELARGEIIAFLDDDDAWQASYLDAQVAHLEAHPDVDLSFADHIERDAGGRESWPDTRSLLVYPSPLVRLLCESFIHTMSVVVCRRSAFDRAGLFDESLHIVHDLDWYARVLATGGRIAHLPRLLVERAVPGGLVTSHREWFREEGLLLTRTFAAAPAQGQHERLVRAYRSLFFARIGLGKGSLAFGLSRLAEALRVSTAWTIRIAAFRLLRRAHLDWRDVPDGLAGRPASLARVPEPR